MKTNEKKYDATTLIEFLNEQKKVFNLRIEHMVGLLSEGKTFSEVIKSDVFKAYTAQLHDLNSKITAEAIFQELATGEIDFGELLASLVKAMAEDIEEESE